MAVKVLAFQGDKQLAGTHRTAIGAHAIECAIITD
jgi:hypothetical protein